jgi:hypothetical protein
VAADLAAALPLPLDLGFRVSLLDAPLAATAELRAQLAE